MAFDKNSFLAGLAVGRRLTLMSQNGKAEISEQSLKEVKISADNKSAETSEENDGT